MRDLYEHFGLEKSSEPSGSENNEETMQGSFYWDTPYKCKILPDIVCASVAC